LTPKGINVDVDLICSAARFRWRSFFQRRVVRVECSAFNIWPPLLFDGHQTGVATRWADDSPWVWPAACCSGARRAHWAGGGAGGWFFGTLERGLLARRMIAGRGQRKRAKPEVFLPANGRFLMSAYCTCRDRRVRIVVPPARFPAR